VESLRTAPAPLPVERSVYKPISALAVAALLVSILAALVITGFGVAAAVSRRPFLSGFVVALSAAALALAITAKIQLARSQGTRAGGKIANAALLLSLVFGSGYLAYWFAIDFAVGRQAREIADRFVLFLIDGQPERAFRLMREPAQQRSMSDDPESIRRRFGNTDLALFNRSDLPRLLRSWKGRTEYSYEGVRSIDVTPAGYEVALNYRFHFPEGIYPVGITALGSDDPDTGQRQWQLIFGKTGPRSDERKLTKLGKLIFDLQVKSHSGLPEWRDQLVQAGAKAAEPFIRLEGNVPAEDIRTKIAAELMDPSNIRLYPGGPTRPLGYSQVTVTDDSVLVTNVLETSCPSVGNEMNTLLTRQVRGDALVKEMLQLAGPGWQQQPINTDPAYELPRYQYEFELLEINIRPSSPKMGLRVVTPDSTPVNP
jgi:hypothetical protein